MYQAAGLSVLNRVVQQIDKDLHQLVAVAKHGCAVHAGLDADFDIGFRRHRFERVASLRHKLANRDGGLRLQVRPCFHLAQRHEIVDKPGHAGALLGHDGEEAVAGGLVVARSSLKRLDKSQQRGERRLDFVARIRDEVGPQLIQAPLRQVVQENKNKSACPPPRLEPGNRGRHMAHHRNAIAEHHRLQRLCLRAFHHGIEDLRTSCCA